MKRGWAATAAGNGQVRRKVAVEMAVQGLLAGLPAIGLVASALTGGAWGWWWSADVNDKSLWAAVKSA